MDINDHLCFFFHKTVRFKGVQHVFVALAPRPKFFFLLNLSESPSLLYTQAYISHWYSFNPFEIKTRTPLTPYYRLTIIFMIYTKKLSLR